jgi:hypothetical protein
MTNNEVRTSLPFVIREFVIYLSVTSVACSFSSFLYGGGGLTTRLAAPMIALAIAAIQHGVK